ncbi:organic cation transporter protein-like [Argopecten irradians]|uniref:organic cation transporter protein-like n=1 Tax=Argopecten irradians TaxID=31199 RepID=UPI003723DF36
MDFDVLLKKIGGFGRYQKIRLCLICLVGTICAFHSMNMVFVGAKPEFECTLSSEKYSDKLLSNVSLEKWIALLRTEDECSLRNIHQASDFIKNGSLVFESNATDLFGIKTAPCTKWEYSTEIYGPTITSDFNLVCSQAWLRSTSKTLYFFGRLLGALIFGQLSDIFGRKPMFFTGLLSLLLAGCVAGAAPSMAVFIPFYILQGAAQTGLFLVAYIMCTELVETRFRLLAGHMITSFYAVGYVLLSLLAYYIRHWRYIEVVITVPVILFAVYWCILPESVRWLLTQNRLDEAKSIIKRVAKTNKMEVTEAMLEQLTADNEIKPEVTDDRKYTLIDLFRPLPMFFLSANVWFNWFVNSFVYYGLSLGVGSIGGSPYINFSIAGAVEIPGNILCVLFLNRLGRRLPLMAAMTASGIACVISGFIPSDMMTAKVAFALIGKFCISISYGIIYLMSAEVFPTVVRNAGMGVSSVCARVGGMLAPQVLELDQIWAPLPMLILGSFTVVAGLVALLLPETTGRPMPQTIEEALSNRSRSIKMDKKIEIEKINCEKE